MGPTSRHYDCCCHCHRRHQPVCPLQRMEAMEAEDEEREEEEGHLRALLTRRNMELARLKSTVRAAAEEGDGG